MESQLGETRQALGRPGLEFPGHVPWVGSRCNPQRKRSDRSSESPMSQRGESLTLAPHPTQTEAKHCVRGTPQLPRWEQGLPPAGSSLDHWPCLCWFGSNRAFSPRVGNGKKEIHSSCYLMLPTAGLATVQPSLLSPLGGSIRVSTAQPRWGGLSPAHSGLGIPTELGGAPASMSQ